MNGNWSEWSDWNECTVTCGGGEQNRFRSCDNPLPAFGGKPCPGERQGTRPCNEFPCAGKYSDAHLSCSLSHTRVGLSRLARKMLELSCSLEWQKVAKNWHKSKKVATCEGTSNFKFQKVDKHSRNSHKLKFSMKSLAFPCLIHALNLYFAQKLTRKAKLPRGC